MTFDYSEVAANALETLTEFGQNVTRRSYTAGTYDTATGLVTPTTADTTRKGAIFDFGVGQTLERGALIQAGDKRILISADGALNLQDHIIVGSKEYVIISMGEINPAGTTIIYDLHLRNG